MKAETDGAVATYQDRMAVVQEVSEALLEGVERMEHVWLEQTRKVIEGQSEFCQAALTLRDPQGLAALYAAFFSRSPRGIFESQQQILDMMTEMQTKISDALGKHMARVKMESEPSRVANTEGKAGGSADSFHSAWNKAFQDAIELASLGMGALPLGVPNHSNPPAGKKRGARATRK